jgi:hypothetical protein
MVQRVEEVDVHNYKIQQISKERDHRSPYKQNEVTGDGPPPYTVKACSSRSR